MTISQVDELWGAIINAYVHPQAKLPLSNKLMFKDIAKNLGYRVPETYKVIRSPAEINDFITDIESVPDSFVVKGCTGDSGQTVKVIARQEGSAKPTHRRFITEGGTTMYWYDAPSLQSHMLDIHSGKFSPFVQVYQTPDGAISQEVPWKDIVYVEEKLQSHPDMTKYLECGVADLRLTYWKLCPIHARLRLSTKEGDGRSNISLNRPTPNINMDGITTSDGILGENDFTFNGHNTLGITIPEFEECLTIGAEICHALQINTVNVDIALARNGPTLLEAHGGTAEWAGKVDVMKILGRIMDIEDNVKEIKDVETGLALGKRVYNNNRQVTLEEVAEKLLGRKEECEKDAPDASMED